MWNNFFDIIGEKLLPTKAVPIALLNLLIMWHRNKTACSQLNPVQSSRSKSRKGSLLRFELNSTVTSDGGTQKLGNYVWYDSESIATKVCSPIGHKWNATWANLPRKGRLLIFKLISAVISDGGAQKLENNVWHDFELIATKVCSQIGRKWNAMFESHAVTSVDRMSFNYGFEDFLSNLSL